MKEIQNLALHYGRRVTDLEDTRLLLHELEEAVFIEFDSKIKATCHHKDGHLLVALGQGGLFPGAVYHISYDPAKSITRE
jgi:hypothetical protein